MLLQQLSPNIQNSDQYQSSISDLQEERDSTQASQLQIQAQLPNPRSRMARLLSYHKDALRLAEAIRKINGPAPLLSIDHHQTYHNIMSIILYWAAGKQLFDTRLQEHHGWVIGFYMRQVARLVRQNQPDGDEDGDEDGEGGDEEGMSVMADTVEEMMADSMRARGWTCAFERPRRNEVLECCEGFVRGLGGGLRGVLVGGSGGGNGN